MRSLIPLLLVLTFAVPAAAAELKLERIRPVADVSVHEPRMANLSPTLRAWVSAKARTTLDSGAAPDADAIASAVKGRLAGQDFSQGDIESLVQLVMMECSRQADADLRDIMEQMRETNERKARRRQAAAAQNDAKKELSAPALAEVAGPEAKAICVDPPCQFAARTGSSPPADADSDADAMSEMGESDQLRLQMAMDRMTKADSAASNAMKKFSETASTITSNLK